MIAVLISAIISLGISIVFRELTKGNNTIDKAKRYMDKRQSDLDEYYKKIVKSFEMMATDIDSRQTQANAAVKVLSRYQETFADEAKKLEGSMKAAKSIDSQLNSYSKVLADLNEMTANVEENLRRVHKESGIVDTLFARLRQEQQKMDALQKSIPQVSANFTKHNEEQLKTIGAALLDEYKNCAKKLDSDIAAMRSDAEKALDSIRRNIQTAYEEASKKAKSLEDTAFEHLSQQSQIRAEQYMKKVKEQTDYLDGELARRVDEARAGMESSFSKISAQIKSGSDELEKNFAAHNAETAKKCRDAVSSVYAETKESLSAMSDKFSRNLNSLSDSYSDKVTSLHEKYSKLLDSIANKNNGVIARISAQFDEDFGKISAKYNEQMDSVGLRNTNNFDSLTEKFNADYQKLVAMYTKAFEGITSDNSARIENLRTQFDSEYGDITRKYEQAMSGFENSSESRMNEFELKIQDAISSLENDCTEKLNGMNVMYTNQIDGMTENYRNRIDEFENSYDPRLRTIETKYEERTSVLEDTVSALRLKYEDAETDFENSIDGRFREFEDTYSGRLAELQSSLDESLRRSTETSEFLRKDVDGNSGAIQTVRIELDDELKRLQEKYMNLFSEAVNSADEKEKAAFEQLSARASESIGKYADSVRRKVAEVQQEFAAAKQRYDDDRREFEREMSSEFENFRGDCGEKMAALKSSVEESLRRNSDDAETLRRDVDGNAAAISDVRTELENELAQLQERYNNLFCSAVAAADQKERAVFDRLSAKVTENIGKYTEAVKQKLVEAQQTLSEVRQEYDDERRDFEQVMNEKFRDFEDECDSKLVDIRNSIEDSIRRNSETAEFLKKDVDGNSGAIQEIKAGLDEELRKLTDRYASLFDQAVASADEKEKAAFERMNQNAGENIDSYGKALKQKISELKDAVSSELKAIADETKISVDGTQEAVKAVRSELDSRRQDFERIVADEMKSVQDGYARKLEDIRAECDVKAGSLQQKCDDVIQSVQKNCDGQLDEIRKDCDDKMNVLRADYMDRFAGLKADCSEKIDALNSDYAGRFEAVHGDCDGKLEEIRRNYIEKIDTLRSECDSRLEKILTGCSDRIDAFSSESEKKITELQNAYTGAVSELKSSLDESLRQSRETTEFLKKDVDGNSGAIRGIKAELDEELRGLREKYLELYNDAVAAADQREKAAFERMNAEAGENIEKYGAEISARIGELRADVEESLRKSGETAAALRTGVEGNSGAIEDVKTELDEELRGLREKYLELYNDAVAAADQREKAAFERMNAEAGENIEKYGAEISARIGELQADVEESLRKSGETAAALRTGVEGNSGAIQDVKAELDEKIRGLREKYLELYNDAVAAADQREKAAFEQMNAKVGESIEKYGSAVAKRIAEMQSSVEESLRKNSETATALRADVDGNSDEIQKVRGDFDESLRQLSDKYMSLFDDALAKADEKEKNAFEQFNAKASESIDKYRGIISQQVSAMHKSLSETLKTITSEAEKSIHDAQESVRALQDECESASIKAAEIQPKLESKIREVSQNIQEFQNSAQIKLDNLSRLISDSIKNAVAESEGRHLSVLEGIDEQIGSYKKDIEYKLSQLETSGADVDTLEKSLRAAMQEVQDRVLSSFSTFSADQQRRQSDFSKSVKENASSIEAELDEIRRSVDELKASASDNISNQLNDFEDTFTKNLAVKGNQIDTELVEWKQQFDSKLKEFANSYADSRRAAENGYLDELKNGIAALQAKTAEQYSRIGDAADETGKRLQADIDELKNTINSFRTEAGNRIDEISRSSEEHLKSETEKNLGLMNSQLAKIKSQLETDIRTFEDSLKSRQETGVSSIDAALAEFNSWKQQIKHQLDESTSLFSEELDSFKASSRAKIEESAQKIMAEAAGYSENIRKQQNDLMSRLEELQNNADSSIGSYQERSAEIEERLRKMYADMVSESDERIKSQNALSEQNLSLLRQEIQNASEQNRATQSKFVLKMQNDANDMQSRMSELSKELNEIKSNIQLYEKADQMKRHLEDNITSLRNSIERIEKFSDTAGQLSGQYDAICRMNEDIGRQLASVESQKNRVVMLEQQFDKLMALSGSIDERIGTFRATSDDLQTMEVSVRNYKDKLDQVSQQYERLEKKNEVIERVLKDVDVSYNQLKDIEQRLSDCSRKTQSLPLEIKDVQNNVDRILQSAPKISDAVGKINSLDTMIDQTEKRINDITNVQNGIKQTELNLQELSREVKVRYDGLHQLTKEEVSKNQRPKDTGIAPSERETIRALKRDGWSVKELASRFKRTETEIDLLLQLPD